MPLLVSLLVCQPFLIPHQVAAQQFDQVIKDTSTRLASAAYGYTSPITEEAPKIPERMVYNGQIAPDALGSPRTKVTPQGESMPTPTPKPLASPGSVTNSPLRSSVLKSGWSARCLTNPNAFGCCLDVLKLSGDLPDEKVSTRGTAATVPVIPLEISEGETALVITNEGKIGHAVKIKKENGKLKSILEGGMGYKSVGREVKPGAIKGEIKLR